MAKYEVVADGKSKESVTSRQQIALSQELSVSSSSGNGSSTSGHFCNVRELSYERAAAMVASWPRALRSAADVDSLAAALPYLGDTMVRHLSQAVSGYEISASSTALHAEGQQLLLPKAQCAQLDDYEADSFSSNGRGAVYSSAEFRVVANGGWLWYYIVHDNGFMKARV